MDERLQVLRVRATRDMADIVQAMLELLGHTPSAWHEEDDDTAVVEVFDTNAETIRELMARVETILGAHAPSQHWAVSRDELPAQDWQESWKAFFHTARVSSRIVVKPTWEFYTATPGDCVIEIDPGMSFGTGTHPTTRGCLQFLDDISRDHPGRSFLDLGCGSGILSIAAAKLGYREVVAMDYDADAVTIAGENCGANGVGDAVSLSVADLTAFSCSRTFDVVCANILAPVLKDCAAVVTACVTPDPRSRLLLAGILTSEYDGVRDLYMAHGFAEVRRLDDDEWTSGLFSLQHRVSSGQTARTNPAFRSPRLPSG
jgi:ribosomal protein L11 methyltransferase